MGRLYDYTLAGSFGATQAIQAIGNMLRVTNAPFGPVQVKTNRGDTYELDAGQGIRLPPDQVFREVYLYNLSGFAQTGTIYIGDSTFEDNRAQGNLAVVDGMHTQTLAEQEFSGSFNCGSTPAAGFYGQQVLWNNTSDKIVIVHGMAVLFTDLAMNIRLRACNAPMATPDVTTQFGSKRIRTAPAGGSGANIVVYGRTTGTMGNGNDVAGLISGPINMVAFRCAAGNQMLQLPGLDRSPIIVGPSSGLVMTSEATAQSNFQILINATIRPLTVAP